MRIALTFPGCHRRGGVERVLVECANTLASRGHAIHVFASDIDPAVLAPSVTAHRIDCGSGPKLLQTARFADRAQAAMESAAKTSGQQWGGHGSFGVVCPPGGVLWVQSVHREWLAISRATRSLSGRLKQTLNPFHHFIHAREKTHFLRRNYKHLIALTPTVEDELVRHFRIPRADISVLPNGFRPAEFSSALRLQNRDAKRRQLGYADSDRVIVFAANETERKGLIPLIHAIAQLGDPAVKLLAVGRLNPAESAPAIAQHNLASRIHFTGPTSSVADFYAAADVFALPTKYEAWGLVIIEAMATGLPALTSRLAGAAVAITEGPSSAATGSLLDNPTNPNEIAEKLRPLLAGRHAPPESIAASVQPYTWDRILDRYEDLLHTAFGHPAPKRRPPPSAPQLVEAFQ